MLLVHLEVLVEEESMEAVLKTMLPTMVPNATLQFQVFQGKAALLQRLPQRLRGLRRVLLPHWAVLVVVDRDGDDCMELKNRLEQAAREAGLTTLTQNRGGPFSVINRIAVEELEAWYFGDWPAVKAAYPRVPITIPKRSRFRNSDAIAGGTWEAFEQILQRSGYFTEGLRKIEAAEAIAPHMDPARNTSRSFQVFRDALLEAAAP
jgi:hypothetical protein